MAGTVARPTFERVVWSVTVPIPKWVFNCLQAEGACLSCLRKMICFDFKCLK